MKPILNIENLTKVYGTLPNQTRALNGITFQVMPGEFLGIMGSSGSGKSTLLNCIATVIQPTGGSIQVEGDTLQSLKEKALAEYRGKKVGYLFQNFVIAAVITFKISFKFLFCIVIVHVRWSPLNFFGILLDCIL